jgi:hypothetical protein
MYMFSLMRQPILSCSLLCMFTYTLVGFIMRSGKSSTGNALTIVINTLILSGNVSCV